MQSAQGSLEGHQSIYSLKLAADIGWTLCGTKKAGVWLSKLAQIMELKRGPSVSYPRVIVCRGDVIESNDVCGINISTCWHVKRKNVFDLWTHDDTPDLIFDIKEETDDSLDFLRMSFLVSLLFIDICLSGGLPFHAALLENRGRGILLAASGGKGKTTSSRRLPPHWRVLCDDETLVIKDGQGNFRVHPFPTWSEYIWRKSAPTWNVESHLPLAAIFFLDQAEKDKVISLGRARAAAYMNRSAKETVSAIKAGYSIAERQHIQKKIFESAIDIGKAVPAYLLRSSPTGRFWEKIEEVLEWGSHSKEKEREFKGVIYEGRSGT
ncbi:MAG: SynChlorMet cassette protein ScmC [Deltaproteobacteria bacterium]|nr:SynChlorMet cassette protein ScmC [Deltaproteobacteria bacterium]